MKHFYWPHQQLARAASSALAPFGVGLNGGLALNAHGFVMRPHDDIDMASSSMTRDELTKAGAVLLDTLREYDPQARQVSQGPTWYRFSVNYGNFRTAMDLAVTPRFEPLVLLADWGMVYSEADAVCHKVGALHDRGRSQDFDDFDRIMRSGRWGAERIVREVRSRGLEVDFGRLAGRLVENGPVFVEYALALEQATV